MIERTTLGHFLPIVGLSLSVMSCDRCSTEKSEEEVSSMTSPFALERPGEALDHPLDRVPLGEWGNAEDYRMRALEARTCEVEPYFAPQPGHEKLGVLVELEGRSKRDVPVNALHASLRDAEGQNYSPTLAGCRPALPAGRITEKAKARGFVSFEVPKDATGLVLKYEPFIVGRPPEALRFDLRH